MTTYNQAISRTGVAARMPEVLALGLIKEIATQESAAMRMFRNVRMSTKQERFPVLASFPVAYWVDGDTGLKQTTTMTWKNKYITAEELAVIVPVPDAVAADLEFNIWDAILPYIKEAIARAFDEAVFFGVNAPASFPTNIVDAAIAAGNSYERGTAAQAAGGVVEDLNQVLALLEADGYDATGFVAPTSFKSRLRGARDTTGQALADLAASTIWGLPVAFGMRGQWPTASGDAELIAADFDQFAVGIREDIMVKIADEASLHDASGNLIVNLFQQDMKAMRVTFRAGWQVGNPINREDSSDPETTTTRYPASVLVKP